MLYVIAIFIPPLAILLCGRLFQALFNAAIWLLSIALIVVGLGIPLWIICVVHAFAVIGGHNADRRTNRIIKALRNDG